MSAVDDAVDAIKKYMNPKTPRQPTHGGKSYEDIVNEAEDGPKKPDDSNGADDGAHSSTQSSNTGRGGQSTDAYNKY